MMTLRRIMDFIYRYQSERGGASPPFIELSDKEAADKPGDRIELVRVSQEEFDRESESLDGLYVGWPAFVSPGGQLFPRPGRGLQLELHIMGKKPYYVVLAAPDNT